MKSGLDGAQEEDLLLQVPVHTSTPCHFALVSNLQEESPTGPWVPGDVAGSSSGTGPPPLPDPGGPRVTGSELAGLTHLIITEEPAASGQAGGGLASWARSDSDGVTETPMTHSRTQGPQPWVLVPDGPEERLWLGTKPWYKGESHICFLRLTPASILAVGLGRKGSPEMNCREKGGSAHLWDPWDEPEQESWGQNRDSPAYMWWGDVPGEGPDRWQVKGPCHQQGLQRDFLDGCTLV